MRESFGKASKKWIILTADTCKFADKTSESVFRSQPRKAELISYIQFTRLPCSDFISLEYMERKLYQQLTPLESIVDCLEVTWNVYTIDIKSEQGNLVNCTKTKIAQPLLASLRSKASRPSSVKPEFIPVQYSTLPHAFAPSDVLLSDFPHYQRLWRNHNPPDRALSQPLVVLFVYD